MRLGDRAVCPLHPSWEPCKRPHAYPASWGPCQAPAGWCRAAGGPTVQPGRPAWSWGGHDGGTGRPLRPRGREWPWTRTLAVCGPSLAQFRKEGYSRNRTFYFPRHHPLQRFGLQRFGSPGGQDWGLEAGGDRHWLSGQHQDSLAQQFLPCASHQGACVTSRSEPGSRCSLQAPLHSRSQARDPVVMRDPKHRTKVISRWVPGPLRANPHLVTLLLSLRTWDP